MKEIEGHIDRREFMKVLGAAGLGSVFASSRVRAEGDEEGKAAEEKEAKLPQVPRRKLGKTGVEVASLSLGSNAAEDPILLRKALDWGINYWDTSYVAGGGNSELGIGKFISQNPEIRKKLFIVTKESESENAEDLEKCLKTSLERMKTDYVDLYIGVYMMSNPAKLTDEVKEWAESAKKRKLIRFFGFTTHKNMPACLNAAAKCGWVDAIMTAYNFRLSQDKDMQAAIEACSKAGVGLIAMKTQGRGAIEKEEDKKLVAHFLEQGFTEGQTKIKAVLEDKRFSSVCSAMGDLKVLTENVAAVLDKTSLSQADMEVLKEYAESHCSGYCAGCGYICEGALPEVPYVSDIMRYLMYYNNYGQQVQAKELFSQIPREVRAKLLKTDYRLAESRCPQRMPIGKLVFEAVKKLS